MLVHKMVKRMEEEIVIALRLMKIKLRILMIETTTDLMIEKTLELMIVLMLV